MKIGIAIFAYNRDEHLSRTLEGLHHNKGVEEIYVFHDGLKCEQHREGWEKTRNVIENIDWCKVRKFFSIENKGLACSIVDGINRVMKENEAVVALEDDCVPTASFMAFMTQCFYKYKDNKEVYSVSGASWPIELKKDKYDIYFNGRINSTGWGTWKDRWEKYIKDKEMIYRLRNVRDKSIQLDLWGSDLEQMYIDNINGKNDSWAVYWALKVIENNGWCINPYKSLIRNIGWDGTGVHCGKTKDYDVAMDERIDTEFVLPDKVQCPYCVKEAFTSLYGSYTALGHYDEHKKNVLVYGVGKYWRGHEKLINEKYNVVGFIDKNKKGWYAGKKIVTPTEIDSFEYDYIMVMLYDREECKKVKYELKERYDIPTEKILDNYYNS